MALPLLLPLAASAAGAGARFAARWALRPAFKYGTRYAKNLWGGAARKNTALAKKALFNRKEAVEKAVKTSQNLKKINASTLKNTIPNTIKKTAAQTRDRIASKDAIGKIKLSDRLNKSAAASTKATQTARRWTNGALTVASIPSIVDAVNEFDQESGKQQNNPFNPSISLDSLSQASNEPGSVLEEVSVKEYPRTGLGDELILQKEYVKGFGKRNPTTRKQDAKRINNEINEMFFGIESNKPITLDPDTSKKVVEEIIVKKQIPEAGDFTKKELKAFDDFEKTGSVQIVKNADGGTELYGQTKHKSKLSKKDKLKKIAADRLAAEQDEILSLF